MRFLTSLALTVALLTANAGAAELFADGFDAADLSQKWDITRPNTDAMAVEKGELLLLSSRYQSIEKEEIQNILMPKVELPPGDWSMSLVFSGEFRTVQEELLFGIAAGKLGENDVWASIGSDGDKYYGWSIYGAAGRTNAAKQTRFSRTLLSLGCNVCPKGRMFDDFMKMVPQPIQAKLRKTGQQYVLSARLGNENPWIELERITAIRATGRPFIVLRQRKAAEGETLVKIDKFTIESP
jgi:hypothetical protein